MARKPICMSFIKKLYRASRGYSFAFGAVPLCHRTKSGSFVWEQISQTESIIKIISWLPELSSALMGFLVCCNAVQQAPQLNLFQQFSEFLQIQFVTSGKRKRISSSVHSTAKLAHFNGRNFCKSSITCSNCSGFLRHSLQENRPFPFWFLPLPLSSVI